MNRRSFLMTSAATATAASLGLPAFAADPLKVGFVYVGPVNDGGWTQGHDHARQEMVKALGAAVETTFLENIPEGPDAERAITQLALSGHKLIFTTSFGFMDPTINVAAKFPDVKFEHATGFKTADNVAVYNARFYEGRAVQGTIAGRMTKTNKIGYIASVPIPEVIQGINAAYLHAKKVNPAIEFSVIWIYSWVDPAKEADAAKALIEAGCDVVMQHTDSTAPQAVAKEKGGIITFGQASDMIEFAPSPRVTSTIDNWAPYYIERAQAVIDGTWKSENRWGGIASGMVGIGEITSAVPAEVKTEVEKLIEDIKSGAYHPFTGPLKKQDGSDWLAAGASAPDGDLAGMMFYVEGLTAELPK